MAITSSTRTEDTSPYEALHPERHEIRLIEYAAPSEFSTHTGHVLRLACIVKAYSLDDYTNGYTEFDRRALTSWTANERLLHWKFSSKAGSDFEWLPTCADRGEPRQSIRLVMDGVIISQ